MVDVEPVIPATTIKVLLILGLILKARSHVLEETIFLRICAFDFPHEFPQFLPAFAGAFRQVFRDIDVGLKFI